MYMSIRMFFNSATAADTVRQSYMHQYAGMSAHSCFQTSSRPAVSAMLPSKPAWDAPALLHDMHMVLQGKRFVSSFPAISGLRERNITSLPAT